MREDIDEDRMRVELLDEMVIFLWCQWGFHESHISTGYHGRYSGGGGGGGGGGGERRREDEGQ